MEGGLMNVLTMNARIKAFIQKIPWTIFTVSVLTVIGLYNRVILFVQRDVWGDEQYQLQMIQGPFKAFWTHQFYGDHTHFPGEYLLTYPFVQLFGSGKWVLAAAHIPFMLLLFYFLYKIGRLYFDSIIGFVVMLLIVDFNESLVFHALEYRPYAVLPAISLGCFYFAHQIVYNYPILSLKNKWLIALFFVLAVNYHAYGILIAGLPLAFHIVVKERFCLERILRSDYLAYVIRFMFAASVIWVWYASGNSFGMSPNNKQAICQTFQFTIDPRKDFMLFLDKYFGNLMGCRNLYLLFWGALPLYVLLSHKRLEQALFFLILIVLPAVLIIAVDIKTEYWLLKRQYIWVMPYFAMLIGWFYDQGYITIKRCNGKWTRKGIE